MAKVLILDDDPSFSVFLARALTKKGHDARVIHQLAVLKEGLREFAPDVLLLDVHLPDGYGLDAISLIEEATDSPQIIVITGNPDDDAAKQALLLGVWDYISKSDPLSRIILAVERAMTFRSEKMTATAQSALRTSGIVGNSPKIKRCLVEAAHAAQSDAPVLLTGETGTGKELIARAIHNSSARRDKGFIVVDCTAIPSQLAESILFGHIKGAFTGADSDHEGLIQLANGGTLFLDEVGEMGEDIQKRFLRVIQEKTFRPVGDVEERTCDFRIIAATNRDLDRLVAEGAFRLDLLHRIRSMSIHLPPLRERTEDIVPLADYHLHKVCYANKCSKKAFSPDFCEELAAYEWPGNVRELMQTVEASLSRAEGFSKLFAIHLPERVRARHFAQEEAGQRDAGEVAAAKEILPFSSYRKNALRSVEREYIIELMQRTKGDMELASGLSGLGRARLYGLLKEHGVSRHVP
jgi:two-component system NtrC family response regulator